MASSLRAKLNAMKSGAPAAAVRRPGGLVSYVHCAAMPETLYSPASEALRRIGVNERQIDEVDRGAILDYGSVAASWESIPHDVDNCAWDIRVGGETAFYATDCGSLDGIDAPSRSLYLVEANYITEELRARRAAKIAAGEFSYESRAESTHLSREQAEAWVREQTGHGSNVIYLHQHKESKNA